MKLRAITNALRSEPLPILAAEALQRGIRFIRRSTFQLGRRGGACPVRFQPIGYYRLRAQPASEADRAATLAYADAILRGEYPLMGYGSPYLGTKPDWQLDWVSGKSWPFKDSRKIHLVRHDGSDVKVPWELSRLQWSPLVAKAYVLTGEKRYREALRSVLTDWIERNPVGRGVNWAIAMEAALRGISLCLTMELLWPFADEETPWLDQLTASLWEHVRFVEAHSEFSLLIRSNHYLSNIVGLSTLSAYLHGPGMQARFQKYARAVEREILLQTYPDGGDCEASTGYHVLVAQMFLHSFVVQQQKGAAIAPEFEARLRRMFDWIVCLANDACRLPHLGDCDNGRVELLPDDVAQSSLPAAERDSLQIGSLCRLASHLIEWPLGDQKPASFMLESGIGVLRSGEASVVFYAMPNGLNGKGSHTHCDKLSIVLRLGPNDVFCDSGSRCYTRSVRLRNLDRSTKAHNTLMVDNAEQNLLNSDPRLLFRSGNDALVSRMEKLEGGELGARASHRGYSRLGVEHQRTVQLMERSLVVLDEVSGTKEHLLDLHYVLGPEWRVSSEMMDGETVSCIIAGPRRLSLHCEAAHRLTLTVIPAEISREYGATLPATCIRIRATAWLPARVQTRVRWD